MPESVSPKTRDTSRDRLIGYSVGAFVMVALIAIVAGGSTRGACRTCHTAAVDRWTNSAHASTTCYECHVGQDSWGMVEQKTAELTEMYPSRLVRGSLVRPASYTSREACLACHADILDAVISGNRISINHTACAAGVSCDPCHATIAHGDGMRWQQGPVMEDCIICHGQTDVSTECDTCHTGDSGARVTTGGPWKTTHGPNWKETHSISNLDSCIACHARTFCSSCHGEGFPHDPDFGARHGDYATADIDSCDVCHEDQESLCAECHGTEMPHPEGFLESHSAIAAGTNDPACVRCHAENDCLDCHSFHIHPGGGKGVPVPWEYTPEAMRQ